LAALAVFLAGTPALPQAVVPGAEFCRELTRAVTAVEKEKLDPLKGRKLSKTEWEARANLPGMSECKIEDPGPAKSLESLLLDDTSYRCKARFELPQAERTPVKDAAEAAEARKKDAARAREEADKRFAAFERAVADCLPGLPVERSVGTTPFRKGMPNVVFKKTKNLTISLSLSRTLSTIYYIHLDVVSGF
jgi:hypothetical protein